MPIRLLVLKAVQRTKLLQHPAAASVASLALGSFSPSQGLRTGCVSCRGVRDQPREAQQPSSLDQHGSDQPRQHVSDKAASSPCR